MNIHVLLTTITWEFASRSFAKRYGFDAWTGCVMNESRPGTLSGRVHCVCDENNKRDFGVDYCRTRGVTLDQVFAVGDSRSDIPLFGVVGYSVALNASPDAIAAASCSIETHDLSHILRLYRALSNRARSRSCAKDNSS